jgi:hypothetical protein
MHRKVSRKAVLSPSGDQDDTYASYIRPNWPDIATLPTGASGATLHYFAPATASAENAVYYSRDWTHANISSVGPFGPFYRVWGDGKQMVKNDIFDYFGIADRTAEQLRAEGYIVWLPPRPKGEFLGEGDTFTYLNLFDNGLLGYRDETPGGWAGHPLMKAPSAGASPVPNFLPAAQNAFAARLRWSVTPTYAGANHEPRISIRGSARISARPAETVALRGVVSDPDGNAVSVKWWQWSDVDSYPGQVAFSSATSPETTMQVPADATPGQTIHVVLEATDKGTPALTRYQRFIVSVAR